jgi:hypothetical protein
LTVTGPTSATSLRSLQIGGGSGIATLTLQTGSTFSASSGVTVSSNGVLTGTGIINANVSNSNVIAPVFIEINGDFTQTQNGKLRFDLRAPLTFGRLDASGNIVMDGTFEISLLNDYVPIVGTQFDLIDWGSRSGTFDTLVLPALPNDRQWNVSQLYSAGVLSVSTLGDYNFSAEVDAADYVLWRRDPSRTQAQFDTWRARFGNVAPATVAAGELSSLTSTPEPTAMVLAIAAVGVLTLMRGQRRVPRLT